MTLRTPLLTAFLAFLLLPVQGQVTMHLDATRRGPLVSPYQYGLFYEEINHAGEGGLYAELVRNRSFEEGLEGWSAIGDARLSMAKEGLLNEAQGQALMVETVGASATNLVGVLNAGFWGMNVVNDSTYTLSFWAKGAKSFSGKLWAELRGSDGTTVLGRAKVSGSVRNGSWQRLTATIRATGTDAAGQLALVTSKSGRLLLDVVSLFPYTWKGRPNGMRPDLAQLLADTRPAFLRFPGGCYVEGAGVYENAFLWKRTIGPIETRPGHNNLNWHYYSSDGLGFDEYLQLSEDLGAAPLFVVNVGLGHGFTIPLDSLAPLVQDCLDAIEYANGDATTEWGARRIANGHPAPYNLKFIEIGNENYQPWSAQQSDHYAERYLMFYQAIKKKFPDIVTIGNVESWGTDQPSWRNEHPVEMVDEHYYRSHAWMRQNYTKYDNAPHTIPVYNGEYAANERGTFGRYGNMNSALGEAVYMLGMEKNSDLCRMASFAPIFMHEQDPRWEYDMIHFRQGANFVTPSYHVQKILANSLGHQNLTWTETGNTFVPATSEQKVGLGSMNTAVSYDDVTLTTLTGEPIGADSFADGSAQWQLLSGEWKADGQLSQTKPEERATAVLNIPFTHDNYIYKVRAKKNDGREGFLVVFNYRDANNYAWWNLGAWGNRQHMAEICQNGARTTMARSRGTIENDRWYDIEIRQENGQVTCSLDGEVVHTFEIPVDRALYQSVQLNEAGDQLLLKVVNPHGQVQPLTLTADHMKLLDARVNYELSAPTGEEENTMDDPHHVEPRVHPAGTVTARDGSLTLQVPAYSLMVYAIRVSQVEPEADIAPAYREEDAGKYGYLFAHMHTTQEISCFALSHNGVYWRDLLDGGEAFPTRQFTHTGGMRDAFVYRTQNGQFLLAGTDMTSALGWTSNHRMTFMHSNDLVHWDKWISIDLESPENLKALGLKDAKEMTAAWAPQLIYDPVSGKYVAYYSVGFPDRHRIYYSLLSEDLSEFSEPRVFYDPGFDVIDADIVWNDVDHQYTMVFKREGDRALSRATAPYLVPLAGKDTGACQWTLDPDFGIDEAGHSIEAPSQFRFIGSRRWQLGYQKYSGGYNYRIMDLDEHGANPSNRRDIPGSLAPQHGSFVKLTEAEFRHLETWEQVVRLSADLRAIHAVLPSDQTMRALAVAYDALHNDAGTFAANAAAMEHARALLQETLAQTPDVEEYLLGQARQGQPIDLTPLLQNADFSKGAQGWTPEPAFTAANGRVAEFFNTAFDFSQTLSGLPDGRYELTVQSFYRMGSIRNAVAARQDGTEQPNAVLYANDETVPVMSLYDPSASQFSFQPYRFPDNVTTADAAFNESGLYKNRLTFNLSGGTLRLGIKKSAQVADDWCCFDNFALRFLGK